MVKVLSLILLVLLLLVGKTRGLKTYFSIYLNLALIFILVIITGWGFNPIIPTFIICILISLIVLFVLNGYNEKTLSAFLTVIAILIIFFTVSICLGNNIYIQGYSEETIESIGHLTYNIGINMLNLSNSIIIIGMIGNIIDTSIAISSALYEVHINNPKLGFKELFNSGMNIGKDILGTTTNTLFFAYLGGFMSLLIFFQDFQYSFLAIINSKVFAQEFTRIILSGIAAFISIPLSSLISSTVYLRKDN